MKPARSRVVWVNRAPVLTLWAAVVAERLGFDWNEAVTLGRAVAGLNAYSKGVVLGLFTPLPKAVKAERRRLKEGRRIHIRLLRRAVPARRTPEGIRALSKGRPISPASVERYLESKFGAGLPALRRAMERLARSLPPARLAERGFALYERFRPEVPAGTRGWGAKGRLDMGVLAKLAQSSREEKGPGKRA
jgi:hypothetical protein